MKYIKVDDILAWIERALCIEDDPGIIDFGKDLRKAIKQMEMIDLEDDGR